MFETWQVRFNMDRKNILKKLAELYNIKEVKEGFPSQQACIDWSNKVAPLLKFNKQYYYNFIQNAHKMNLNISSYTLGPAFKIMVSQVQMAIEELKIDIEGGDVGLDLQTTPFVNEGRIEELEKICNPKFDFTKLIKILREINMCYQTESYFAVIVLIRAAIDHVSPIFGQENFKEVVNNHSGTKSFKENMERLENSSRKIADQYLHTLIRKKEILPNKTQINFSNDLDVLLAEIVRLSE